MQQYEQNLQEVGGGGSENLLRQKRFALVLTGEDRLAELLVERLALQGDSAPETGSTPAALRFFAFKKLYELWMAEAKNNAPTTSIFVAGGENEAIQKGLDPSIAKTMGEMPSLHRALLLLIYGEKFSYAASAQLLNISVEDLMTALAFARARFLIPESGRGNAVSRNKDREVSHDAAQ